jgi:hypothetical protein
VAITDLMQILALQQAQAQPPAPPVQVTLPQPLLPGAGQQGGQGPVSEAPAQVPEEPVSYRTDISGLPRVNLTGEEHDAARNRGLLLAGLTAMEHRGRGLAKATLGAFEEGYADVERRVMAQRAAEHEEEIQQAMMAAGDDPKSLVATARLAAALGQVDAAKAILDMAKATYEFSKPAEAAKGQVVGDAKSGYFMVNPYDGSVIADWRSVNEGTPALDPLDALEATNKILTSYRGFTEPFADDAIFIDEFRKVAPSAIAAKDPQAQIVFFRALLKVLVPQLRGIPADQVISLADDDGLIGSIKEQAVRAMTGVASDAEGIRRWNDYAEQIIQSRIKLYDVYRQPFVEMAKDVGVRPEVAAFDYFRNHRGRSPVQQTESDAVRDRVERLRKAARGKPQQD